MARKELMEQPNGVFTLNETSVGKGGNNRKRSDIQLIQFFLKQFYDQNPALFALLPPTKKRHSVVVIDGVYGSQTEAAILLFQKDVKARGSSVKVDGLVDVATGLRSVNSKTQFTIMFLNFFFMTRGEGKEHHGKLENHPEVFAFAPELAGELFVSLVSDQFRG